MKKAIQISSVEFRDGQQSLLATRMKTEDMIPILQKMDEVGFCSMEMWGGATFDTCIRYLEEDPWERVRQFKKIVKKTPLRMLIRGQNLLAYKQYPDDIVELFVEKAAEAGIDIFLVFDGLNDLRNCRTVIEKVKQVGKQIEANILYTVSPVHNIDKYVQIAKDYEKMGVSAIHLEDMAGLMNPTDAYEIVSALKEAITVPLHIQCHCTGGMADMVYWEAIRAGVDVIDTDISALSLGTAHPPTESFVAALENTPYATNFDMHLLAEINQYFIKIRTKYKEHESKFTGVDISVLLHQIPGGMLSNMESQLKQMDMFDRIDEVLQEVQKVRKDFGYPPLGTPMSQIVGAQAAMNVLIGNSYALLSNEAKDYIKGMYGKAPGDINPELIKKVVESGNIIDCRPADLLLPGLENIKKQSENFAKTDEDRLMYALFPSDAENFLKKKYQITE